jgi:hypothetical protein
MKIMVFKRTLKLGLTISLFLALFYLIGVTAAAELLPPGNANSSNPPTEETGKANLVYNDYALFIAGLGNPQGFLAADEKKSGWVRYAQFIDQRWGQFDKNRLEQMREWAVKELNAPAAAAPTVFYPFSGPDFINMYTFFPQAKTYLMIALEPVGEIPNFTSREEKNFFAGLQRSIYELLHFDFFITENMKTVLKTRELKGVLPVIMFFMAREKARILDINYWVMKPDGAIEETPVLKREQNKSEGIGGVRIVFEKAGSKEKQTLYYFSYNLRNDSFGKNEHFVSFLKSLGPMATFEKAASYLMHKPGFSGIRQFILDQSLAVLQTDSGIPVKYFEPSSWKLRFYGKYTRPIQLFDSRFQSELASIYKEGKGIQPLPFGIGYRHRLNTSNLMLAIKKEKVLSAEGK